jgi:hypothetical protein
VISRRSRKYFVTMSEHADVSAMAANAMHSVLNSFSKVPASASAPSERYATAPRFFGREKSVHELLGGGRIADVLLWRERKLAVSFLVGSTLLWYLLEHLKYSLVSLVSNALLLFIGALFVWTNVASVLNRPGPPVPELHLSEDFVLSTASRLRVQLNHYLDVVQDIAVGKDFKLFIKVVGALWLVATVGSWFHFLTLLWIVIVVSHTLPVIYEQYKDVIDHYVKVAGDEVHKQYKTIHAAVLSKIPRAPVVKEKKVM